MEQTSLRGVTWLLATRKSRQYARSITITPDPHGPSTHSGLRGISTAFAPSQANIDHNYRVGVH